MTPIKAVAFDLGKVLIDFDWAPALAQIHPRTRLTADEVFQQVLKHPKSIDYEEGRLTSEEYFSFQKEFLGFDGPWTELESLYARIFTPITAHIALVHALQPHYPLALISNTTAAHIDYAESVYDFFSLFQVRIYSYRAGAMKPKPAIYAAAAQALGIEPEEGLFIDDLKPNCEGAEKLGWQTIHLEPQTDLRAALRLFGLKGV
jgi:FMN phosphatase YigB (HAD superfamily)